MAQKTLPDIIGINQLADETAMKEDRQQMFVREANNVDIDKAGNVNRREGYTQLLAGSNYHSLYSSQRGWLMMCNGAELGILEPTLGFTSITTMDEAQLTSYTEENGNLYVMNNGYSCMFKPGEMTVYPIGVPLPSVTVEFTADTTAGSLEAGSYGVTYSIVDPDGEESGLGPVTQVDLTATGRVQVTMLTVMAGYKYRLYMTTVNGEELYEAAEIDADVVSFDIMEHVLGRQPQTFGLEPTPKGHIIRAFNSRLLIATTDFVYFTEAFRPHLHNPAHSFVPVAGFCTMVEPVSDGVFIADKRGVRFYAGDDPTDWSVKDASPDSVVFNTSSVVPGSYFEGDLKEFDEVAVWLSKTGYQVGLPNGDVLRLNAEQVQLPDYVQGCSAFAVRDGRKQFVTPVNSNVLANASVALDSSTI